MFVCYVSLLLAHCLVSTSSYTKLSALYLLNFHYAVSMWGRQQQITGFYQRKQNELKTKKLKQYEK